jgi:CheY-like chemotaxis protein
MSNLILVVEDDPTLQMVTRRALGVLGHECVTVGTGEEAVNRDHADIKLIFMDIGLPGIDGGHATSLIREKELRLQRKRVPIIALTGHAEADQCVKAGMDDFLQKPALMADLDRMIRKWCPDGRT